MSEEPDSEDEWTALADADTLAAETDGPRRKWWVFAGTIIAILVGIVVTIVVLWPGGVGGPGGAGPVSDAIKTPARSADLGLLGGDRPSAALDAFATDTKIVQVSRLLLTRDQVQATGRTDEDEATWEDLLFVENRALSLGDALVSIDETDAFELSLVDGRVLSDLASQTLAAAGDQAAITQVIVRRDSLTDGNPVVIEVYWQDATGLQVTRADLNGAPIA